jgi:predicted aldo/keto reductase-like oxidoreductase
MKPTLLGFGAMRLPKDAAECRKMFAAYLDSGGNYFDTAYVYGGSEEMLKKALTSQYPRTSYMLSGKVPPWSVNSAKDCSRILEESLKRCGVDYFDYYLLHSMGEESEKKALNIGMYEWAQEMKKKGLIRHVGISFHDSPELLHKILAAHSEIEFVMLQLNYVDILRGACGGYHEAALKYNKPIIAMEPIKGGTLANLPKEAETMLKAARPNDSIASWAMRYAASLEGVKSVLSGMSSLAQVQDNIKTFNPFEPMKKEEYDLLSRVMDILAKEANIPCTGCNYCLPECPEGIEISNCLSLYNECQRAPSAKFNRTVLYRSITKGHKASDCTSCGVCVPRCPQSING